MVGRFEGQAAIVTGAAGGIGRATAQRLARDGASVLAVDVKAEDLEETMALIVGDGGRAEALVSDVTGDQSPATIVAACVAAFGGLDMLVNNAGIGGRTVVGDLSDEDWDLMLDTNLRSVFRMSREALKVIATPGGRFVNISSVFGLVGFRRSAAYGAAKAGVAQLTRQMTADFGPQGIRVNAIAPGIIDTPMTARNIREDPWFQKAMIETTPMGIGTPEDVAGVAAFLCSDDARFIAGQVIAVDGGWMAARYLPAL
jgi:NAD(P)-dependent dehydrogenase (short-subunit alcohol dehydrogenase family)